MKILKISMFVLVIVALIASVSAYRLISGENFQSYTAWGDGGNETTFIGQADGDWTCYTPASSPYCYNSAGGGSTYFGYNIGSDGGATKYMSIWAYGSDCTASPDYTYVRLYWNHANGSLLSSWTENQKFLYEFDYRNSYSQGIATCSAGNRYLLQTSLFREARQVGCATCLLAYGQGFLNDYADDENHERMRFYFNTTPSPAKLQPVVSSCDVNDGAWHHIKVFYYVNTSYYLTKTEVWVDEVNCWNWDNQNFLIPESVNPSSQRFVTDNHWWGAQGGFLVSIDNLAIYETNESENFNGSIPLEATSCGDGLDNDYDGFIDYGAGATNDPECTSYSDTSENPFHYTQCNNGIDDDSDSYIDIDDPSCNGTLTNDNEYPSQASTQDETVCLAEEFCIFYEKFPYTDNITLHKWEGNVSSFQVINTLGSGRLYFNNGGVGSFNLWKNISNPNTYNTVQVWFDLAMATKDTWSGTDESIFYVNMLDSDGRIGAYVKFNLTQIDPTSTRCQIYAVDGASEVLVATIFPSLTSGNIVGMKLTVDQVSKQYTVSYRASGEWTEGTTSYAFSDASASKIYAFNIKDPFDSTKFSVYMDNINILGADTNFDTDCDAVESPYVVVESFNGYLAVCGWVTSHNIWNNGYLSLSQATTSYFAQKTFDAISDTSTRYVTWMFDLNVINVTAGSTITVRGYDDTDFNFFTIWWMDTGDNLWYNQNGAGNIATQINLSAVYRVKIIMDMQNDNYDLYLNDSLILDNKGWTTQFYNLKDFNSIKFTSTRSAFTLDNVIIYTSDASGNPLTPSGDIVQPVNNESSMCGLFYKTKPTCTADEDCVTGDCLPNNQCNSFDMTYCDENGYVRGNRCVFTGVASCFFGEATDVIFDNFFYVLVAIIMLIAIVYLSVMLRRR